MIPPPEYKLEVTWRADVDGNGIKTKLYLEGRLLQGSFHPTLNILGAVESALENFFEKKEGE